MKFHISARYCWPRILAQSIRNGRLSEAAIRTSVGNTIKAIFILGNIFLKKMFLMFFGFFYLTKHSTHFYLRLYTVKDHSDSEKGNPLPPTLID